jgi:uncharacterized protein YdaL
MSPPLKSQAASLGVTQPGIPVLKNHAIHSGVISPISGIKVSLLLAKLQHDLHADLNRREGKGGVLPFQPIVGLAPLHTVRPIGISATQPSFASLTTATSPTCLVLYDTAGQWGYLGELYAMAVANLCGHFGQASTEPISAYESGQINKFTATIYIGSTYYDQTNDGIPISFYKDVPASTHPVLWIADNIWNFADYIGVSTFDKKYGWDPTSSFYTNSSNSVGKVTQVNYKSAALTRTVPPVDDGGILRDHVLGGTFPPVTTLAQAVDTSTSPSTLFPWAIRSSNLTYLGENPFDYVTQSDRIIALEDLLFDALAPGTVTRHRAMVRLEDLNVTDDQTQLQAIALYLSNKHIPFGYNIIPFYKDPNGVYSNGVPQSIPLNSPSAAAFVATIKYMNAHGGFEVDEGDTHQYSNVANPYNGVSGDDTEFFRGHVDATNNVIWDGPISGDSTAYALSRVNDSVAQYKSVNLPIPKAFVTPHYFATDVDYRAIATVYPARYESSVYYSGVLSGQPVNYSQYIGEFYPYTVRDVYGTTVYSENLGDYEPVSENNHPIRLPADLINEAKLNLAVRDGYASFFYDPSYGTTPLGQIISGISALGYTWVPPGS